MKTKPAFNFYLFNWITTCLRPVTARLLIFLALSSVVFLSLPKDALSQIPQGFNYQAIARDGSGNPISTAINVKIAILSSTSDDDVIWEEEHTGVDPDDHGLFSIVVGQGTRIQGLASFDLIDWTVTPKYIRTKINDVKMGTSKLWSVPYAMYSPSTNPWLLNGSSVYYSSGFVGVGWGAPWARFQVTENASTAITYPVQLVNMSDDWTATEKGVGLRFGRNENFSLHGWGTIRGTIAEGDGGHGRLQLIGGSGDSPHVTVSWNGNVGIGTTTPVEKLHVIGNSFTSGNSVINGSFFGQAATGSGDVLFIGNDSKLTDINIPNTIGIYGMQDGTQAHIKLGSSGPTISGVNGNVGIGTLDPAYKLHVNGSIASSGLSISNSGIQSGLMIYKSDNPVNQKITEFLSLGSAGAFVGRFVSDTYTESAHWLEVLRNTDSYSVNSVIFPGGNVGVGAATTAKLSIQPSDTWADEVPLFEVKNKYGIPVLAVYNNGVRINVEHNEFTKSPKGGFSVGGYDYAKASKTVDLMIINPDSIRFNINNTLVPTKGAKGGFSVGGFTETKGGINQDFMYLTPQNNSVDNAYNTFLGYQAGNKNIYGDYNTFIGYQAGYNHVGYSVPGGTGNGNVYIGHLAGFTPTYGTQNTFLGYESGSQADRTVGLVAANTFVGYQSGERSSGSSNILLGHSAGYDQSTYGSKTSTGSHNIMIGNKAGGGYTSASYNVLIGPSSGFHLSSGENNVCVGEYTGREMRTSYQNVLIGNFAGEYIGSNQPNPNYDNVVIGYYAGNKLIGNGNVIIGKEAAKNLTTISNQLFINNSPDNPLIWGDFTDGSEQVIINGALTSTGSITSNSNATISGNVGIGMAAGSSKLSISGLTSSGIGSNLVLFNNVVFTSTSRRDAKENITPLEDNFEKILNAKPVSFTDKSTGVRGIGYIAEEFEEAGLQNLLIYENGEIASLRYDLVSLYNLEIIKAQQRAIKDQQQQIDNQNEKIERLEKMILEMQGTIASPSRVPGTPRNDSGLKDGSLSR